MTINEIRATLKNKASIEANEFELLKDIAAIKLTQTTKLRAAS